MVLRKLALPGAWLAAAIWAVHPVNVESVAWITELKNTQLTLFYLLALLAWMKFTARETGSLWRYYALALVLQALALFSKTTACTLPAALLLVLWLRKEPIGWRRCVQVAPFMALGIAMGLLSVWWEVHLGNYDKVLDYSFDGLERGLIATRALWFYAAKLVWPTKLMFSYPRWEINLRRPAPVHLADRVRRRRAGPVVAAAGIGPGACCGGRFLCGGPLATVGVYSTLHVPLHIRRRPLPVRSQHWPDCAVRGGGIESCRHLATGYAPAMRPLNPVAVCAGGTHLATGTHLPQ